MKLLIRLRCLVSRSANRSKKRGRDECIEEIVSVRGISGKKQTLSRWQFIGFLLLHFVVSLWRGEKDHCLAWSGKSLFIIWCVAWVWRELLWCGFNRACANDDCFSFFSSHLLHFLYFSVEMNLLFSAIKAWKMTQEILILYLYLKYIFKRQFTENEKFEQD